MEKTKLLKKYYNLIDWFNTLDSVAIAFSGGLDSTFLLYAAINSKIKNIAAITSKHNFFFDSEQKFAINFAKKYKINFKTFNLKISKNPSFIKNPKNRCYFCKNEMFKQISEIAKNLDIPNICDGSILDDLTDYRPGNKAKIKWKIKSPLQITKFYKKEIQELYKNFNLPEPNRVSMNCYATRIQTNQKITKKKIDDVKKGENYIQKFLKDKILRVRLNNKNIRIEVNENDLINIIKNKKNICNFFKKKGYNNISLDLQGYRQSGKKQ